jgi:exopolysaccharide biosynthesis polyprenyl glycosylphosphotransferase
MQFGRTRKLLGVVLVMVDFLMLVLAFVFAWLIRVRYDDRPLLGGASGDGWGYFWSVVMILPVWLGMFMSLGLYRSRVYMRTVTEFVKVAWGCFVGILLVIGLEYVTDTLIFPARLVMVYVLIISVVAVFVGRNVTERLVDWLLYRKYGATRVLVVGDTEVARSFMLSALDEGRKSVKVVAYMGDAALIPARSGIHHYATDEDLDTIIARHKAQGIVYTGMSRGVTLTRRALAAAERHHVQYSFIPGEPEFYSRTNAVGTFLQFPIVSVMQTPLVGYKVILKRMFDLAVIAVAAPVWVPVFGILILCQKIFNPGPVFFTQKRIGKFGKQLDIYKFRSMWQKYSGQDAIKIFQKMGLEDLAEEYAKTRKIEDDPRIAGWWGKFIRATSLDEVAQLINVIRGEMSLVGPRPILPDELDFYNTKAPLLTSVTPGLTGLASVSGRSELKFEDRVNLELYYASNWSFILDIKILFQTVWVVLTGKGAK